MGWLTDFGNQMGLGDLDRGQNEFRDVNRDSFNLPGFSERDERLNRQGDAFLGREAPQAADSDFREYQRQSLDRLGRLARGEDSLTAGQLQMQQDQMANQQRGLAAGAAPGNAGAAQRWAAQNIARGRQGLGFNQAMAGIAERNAATGALGQLATGARGQDIQRNEFNVGANQAQQGLNQQGWLASQGLGLQNAQSQQQGGFQYEQQRGNRFGQIMTQPTIGERALGAITGAVQMGAQAFGGGAPTAAASSALSSPGYTPEQFGAPMQLQTGPGATPYAPTASPVGYTPGAFNVPMQLAEGGLVTKPTRAIVGEAGPEVVIPLAKLPDLVKRLGERLTRPPEQWDRQDLSRAAPPKTQEDMYYERERRDRQETPVSVISHERDHAAEFPFVQKAEMEDAQTRAREEARLTRPNWDWLTR